MGNDPANMVDPTGMWSQSSGYDGGISDDNASHTFEGNGDGYEQEYATFTTVTNDKGEVIETSAEYTYENQEDNSAQGDDSVPNDVATEGGDNSSNSSHSTNTTPLITFSLTFGSLSFVQGIEGTPLQIGGTIGTENDIIGFRDNDFMVMGNNTDKKTVVTTRIVEGNVLGFGAGVERETSRTRGPKETSVVTTKVTSIYSTPISSTEFETSNQGTVRRDYIGLTSKAGVGIGYELKIRFPVDNTIRYNNIRFERDIQRGLNPSEGYRYLQYWKNSSNILRPIKKL